MFPTDSMPSWMGRVAEYQPLTPMIEALRGLFLGSPIGHNGALAVAWCAGITAVGYLWARAAYTRDLTP